MSARIAVILLMLMASLPVCAGIRGAQTQVIYSADGKCVLVMRHESRQLDPGADIVLPDGRSVNVYDTFPECGVYESDTFRQLWPIDRHSFRGEIHHSDDLRYIARMAFKNSPPRYALQFLDQGKIIKEYEKKDLLEGLGVQGFLRVGSTGTLIWIDRFELSLDHRTIFLDTARRSLSLDRYAFDLGIQEFYSFDIATGRILTRRTEKGILNWLLGISLIIVLFAVMLALRYVIKHARRRVLRARQK